ncbi:MAG: DMT family transporter [Actinomycetia bacterium]|nr:DMT family transporter [Actinomycetes bacterium]
MVKTHSAALSTLKYSLCVFLGGCTYGIMVPLVRMAQDAGFGTMDIIAAQYLFAVLFLGAFVLLFVRRRIKLRQAAELAGLGVIACGVSFGYYHALEALPAATAVTLLFQFAWMGVALQAIVERKLPSRLTLLAVGMIVIGTFLATGVFEQEGSTEITAVGLFFGLMSAVCYTVFLFLSGKVATSLPASSRTLLTTFGSLIIAFALAPRVFFDGSFQAGLALYVVPLALVGILLPLVLIQASAPHLPSGMVSIMAASELPSGIIMAAAFMHDKVSWLVAVGVLVVLVGIVLSQLSHLKEAPN